MIKKENFTIPGANGRAMLVDITYDKAFRNGPLIIFAHGFKGFKDWGTHNLLAQYFAERGFRFLKFNFSHNGTTVNNPVDFNDLIAFSENTFTIELSDLNAVVDFACNGTSISHGNKLYLMGHSMGGGISIIHTARDKRVKKLITLASIASFRNLWPAEAEAQWKLQGMMYFPNSRTGQQMPIKSSLLLDLDNNPVRLDIPAKAAEIKQPWLIIHGDDDTVVPLSHAKELRAANPEAELLIIKGGNHTLGGMHPAESTLPDMLSGVADKVITFLEQ